jgi:hypothetical protein
VTNKDSDGTLHYANSHFKDPYDQDVQKNLTDVLFPSPLSSFPLALPSLPPRTSLPSLLASQFVLIYFKDTRQGDIFNMSTILIAADLKSLDGTLYLNLILSLILLFTPSLLLYLFMYLCYNFLF